MEKLLSKLKKANGLKAQFELEIKNIKESTSPYWKNGEKQREIEKHAHFLGEVNETRAKLLVALREAIDVELETLNHAAVA